MRESNTLRDRHNPPARRRVQLLFRCGCSQYRTTGDFRFLEAEREKAAKELCRSCRRER